MKSFLFCLVLFPSAATAQAVLPKPIADIAMPGRVCCRICAQCAIMVFMSMPCMFE